MKNQDKVKIKIKALLSKTTENGASEAEAINALKNAEELMREYVISIHDIKDPFLGEKLVMKSTARHKSGYRTEFFLGDLATLFDCEYFYTRDEVTFYGFNQDVDLSLYFYELIIKACFHEVAVYRKSDSYRSLKEIYHGRTLTSSFIKGFLMGIAYKMNQMYRERERNMPPGVGLVVVEKSAQVKKGFDALGMTIQENKSEIDYKEEAFLDGHKRSKDFVIKQGIKNHRSEHTLRLT